MWHKCTYLWHRNRLMDKNRLVVAMRKGVRGEVEWEGGVSRYKLLHREWINNKVLQQEGQIWLHVRSVPFRLNLTLTFVLWHLYLVILAVYLLQKDAAYRLKYRVQPIFKAMIFESITFLDKKVAEQRITSVLLEVDRNPDLHRDLQEHRIFVPRNVHQLTTPPPLI